MQANISHPSACLTRMARLASQISIQCLAALLMGTWGILGLQGNFLPIRTTEVLGKQYAPVRTCLRAAARPYQCSASPGAARRTIDNLEPGPDFVLFNTRGRFR